MAWSPPLAEGRREDAGPAAGAARRAPHARPLARRGARCPVPAAAAAARAAAGSRPRAAGAHIRGRRRSLASSAPAAPRRTPASPWRRCAPAAASPSLPPPAPGLPRAAPRPGDRRPTRGSPCTARAVGVAAAWDSGARHPGQARLTRGHRRVKRAPAAGLPLNPLGTAACSPLPPAGPADPAEAGCGLTAPPPAFLRGRGRGTLRLPRLASAVGVVLPRSTPGGGPAPWEHRCWRAVVARLARGSARLPNRSGAGQERPPPPQHFSSALSDCGGDGGARLSGEHSPPQVTAPLDLT